MTVILLCYIIYRMNMRKTSLICLISAFCLSFAACGHTSESESDTAHGGIRVTATVFPAYDFAREIVGERGEVTLLVPPGAESHSYEPTPQDILRLQSSDLLIANGGESEAWLDNITNSLDTLPPTVYMLNEVNALAEETVDGMQSGGILARANDTHAAHSHAHEDEHGDHDHKHDREDETEYDEHVWTSPKNAVLICEAITDRLCGLDAENAEYYRANCASYTATLLSLDAQFRAVAESATHRTLIFADRFPVRYFTEEYGFDYYAAFPGCADDAEPSARTVAFLIDTVRQQQVPAVLYIEFSNEKMADIIAEETGCGTLLFHSCHNVSAAELEGGVSYLQLMEQNLESVKEAVN